MRRSVRYFGFHLFGLAALFFLRADTALALQDYQQVPVTLKAENVLPKTLLKGKNYRIEDEVQNDGLINTYKLVTDYGPLRVESTGELMIRIMELNALVAMEEMDRKNVFGEAVVEGVKAPVKGAAALVTSPVETTKGIVTGTGRFLSNVGRSFVSDDPDQANPLSVAVGYDTAKRKFAYEFGIDPYSSYDPAMDRLGEIARSAVAGGIVPRAAMAAIDSDVVKVMRVSGTTHSMRKLVRDNPPGELRKINKKKLEKMGIDPSLVEAFLDNYRYNPQEETILVGELESMKGVKGRDVFLGKASLAANRSVALFHRLIAQMMAGYHAKVGPAERIQMVEGVLHLKRKDGKLVLLSPVDYVFWTDKLEGKLNAFERGVQKMTGANGKELWISGRMDEGARAQFEKRGWKVQENAEKDLL
jgi:hypothetical protein